MEQHDRSPAVVARLRTRRKHKGLQVTTRRRGVEVLDGSVHNYGLLSDNVPRNAGHEAECHN